MKYFSEFILGWWFADVRFLFAGLSFHCLVVCHFLPKFFLPQPSVNLFSSEPRSLSESIRFKRAAARYKRELALFERYRSEWYKHFLFRRGLLPLFFIALWILVFDLVLFVCYGFWSGLAIVYITVAHLMLVHSSFSLYGAAWKFFWDPGRRLTFAGHIDDPFYRGVETVQFIGASALMLSFFPAVFSFQVGALEGSLDGSLDGSEYVPSGRNVRFTDTELLLQQLANRAVREDAELLKQLRLSLSPPSDRAGRGAYLRFFSPDYGRVCPFDDLPVGDASQLLTTRLGTVRDPSFGVRYREIVLLPNAREGSYAWLQPPLVKVGSNGSEGEAESWVDVSTVTDFIRHDPRFVRLTSSYWASVSPALFEYFQQLEPDDLYIQQQLFSYAKAVWQNKAVGYFFEELERNSEFRSVLAWTRAGPPPVISPVAVCQRARQLLEEWLLEERKSVVEVASAEAWVKFCDDALARMEDEWAMAFVFAEKQWGPHWDRIWEASWQEAQERVATLGYKLVQSLAASDMDSVAMEFNRIMCKKLNITGGAVAKIWDDVFRNADVSSHQGRINLRNVWANSLNPTQREVLNSWFRSLVGQYFKLRMEKVLFEEDLYLKNSCETYTYLYKTNLPTLVEHTAAWEELFEKFRSQIHLYEGRRQLLREWFDHRILRGHRMDNYPDPHVDRRGPNRALFDLRTEASYFLQGYDPPRNIRERCLFMTFGNVQFWYDVFPDEAIARLLLIREEFGIKPSPEALINLKAFVSKRYLPFTQRGQSPETLLFRPAAPLEQTVDGNRYLWYYSPLHGLVEEFQRLIETDNPQVIQEHALRLYGGVARRALLSELEVLNHGLVTGLAACAADYARLAGDTEALKLFAQEIQHYYYMHDRQHRSYIELLVLYSQAKAPLPFHVRFLSSFEIGGFEVSCQPVVWLVVELFWLGLKIFFLNAVVVGLLVFLGLL